MSQERPAALGLKLASQKWRPKGGHKHSQQPRPCNLPLRHGGRRDLQSTARRHGPPLGLGSPQAEVVSQGDQQPCAAPGLEDMEVEGTFEEQPGHTGLPVASPALRQK